MAQMTEYKPPQSLRLPGLERKFKSLFSYEFLIGQFLFEKKGITQKVVHLAKYKSHTKLFTHFTKSFAKRYKHLFDNCQDKPTVVIPIPNHWIKKLKLGYNQTEFISEEVAKIWNIKHEKTLLKKKARFQSQTKKNRIDRRIELQNLYYTNGTLNNEHVLLVDDVITSGATIETCAQTLIDAGARKVSVYCFAFTE